MIDENQLYKCNERKIFKLLMNKKIIYVKFENWI